MKKYIHYGHERFEIEKFVPVKNIDLHNKPKGGFWASPIDAPFGWRNWCEEEAERCDDTNKFVFQIKDNANVIHIRNFTDLEKIPRRKSIICGVVYPDFEKMIEEGIDAIELHLTCNGNRDSDLYFALYGWDCDSILIMNPEIILCDSDFDGAAKTIENNLSK